MKKSILLLLLVLASLSIFTSCSSEKDKAGELSVNIGNYYLLGNVDKECISIIDDKTLQFIKMDTEFFANILLNAFDGTTDEIDAYKEQIHIAFSSPYEYELEKKEGETLINVLSFDGSGEATLNLKYKDDTMIVLDREYTMVN